MSSTARKGKIGRCPPEIRAEVNRRLYEGQTGPEIIAWLNSQEPVLAVLDKYFSEQPITEQNLSEWRQGGYEEWLKSREQLERTKELDAYATKLAADGASLGAGNVAIVGGHLSELFQSLDIEEQKQLLRAKPALFVALIDVLAKLEKSQADRMKAAAGRDMVEIQRKRADQAEAALRLNERRFQVRTCELFLEWFDTENARRIAEGKAAKSVKIEQLRLAMFGPTAEDPDNGPEKPQG